MWHHACNIDLCDGSERGRERVRGNQSKVGSACLITSFHAFVISIVHAKCVCAHPLYCLIVRIRQRPHRKTHTICAHAFKHATTIFDMHTTCPFCLLSNICTLQAQAACASTPIHWVDSVALSLSHARSRSNFECVSFCGRPFYPQQAEKHKVLIPFTIDFYAARLRSSDNDIDNPARRVHDDDGDGDGDEEDDQFDGKQNRLMEKRWKNRSGDALQRDGCSDGRRAGEPIKTCAQRAHGGILFGK